MTQARPTPITAITGGASGLGLALARELSARGHRLYLIGRQPRDSVTEPLPGSARYLPIDVGESDSVAQFAAQLRADGVDRLDYLIHSAAVGWVGRLEDQSPENIRQMFDINFLAIVDWTHALYPLLASARGQVVLVSSTAAWLPAPRIATYAASKAALDAWSRSLAVEWWGRVRVLRVSPGPIRTTFHTKAGLDPASIPSHRFPSAELVARQAIRAMEGNGQAAVLGWGNWAITLAGYWLPSLVDAWMARRR